MKKVSLVILGLICWIGCFAQTEPIVFDNNGEFSRVVEVKSTAKQAFQYCRSFLSSKIKDYQRAVQIEDPNTNRIQVNYQFRFIEDVASKWKILSTIIIFMQLTDFLIQNRMLNIGLSVGWCWIKIIFKPCVQTNT